MTPETDRPEDHRAAEAQSAPDERQPHPDHDLAQDDDLRAGQYGPDQ